MTWIQYASIAVLVVSATTGLLLVASFRRHPITKISVVDQPDGRVLARVERGNYSITTNVPTRAEANAFVKDEVARIKAEQERKK